MLLLPPNISGFYCSKSPEHKSDLQMFQKYSYTVASLTGSRIVSAELPAGYPMNYARITFRLSDSSHTNTKVAVLLNTIHPYMAFVSPMPGKAVNTCFIDALVLANVYHSFSQYEILSAAQAQTPLEPAHYQKLNKAELSQIRSWRPKTVGEVVFNDWD